MGVKLCTGGCLLKATAPAHSEKNWTCDECWERQRQLARAFWEALGVDPGTVLVPRECQ